MFGLSTGDSRIKKASDLLQVNNNVSDKIDPEDCVIKYDFGILK